MWYSGSNNTNWRIGYATSTDGITWTRNSGNNCLGTLGDGCLFTKAVNGNWDDAHTYYPYVIKDETIYKMWYTGHDGSNVRIGYATSNDGLTWTRNSGNNCSGTIGDGCVIPLGSSGETDDVHAFSGYVIKDNETYKMWYTG
ncbi:MAG: Laminin G sub domain 2, partial [candidate division CPR3 bacterium GW2011_GWE2_35_7]